MSFKCPSLAYPSSTRLLPRNSILALFDNEISASFDPVTKSTGFRLYIVCHSTEIKEAIMLMML